MKKLIIFAMLLVLLTACGTDKGEEIFQGVFFESMGSNTTPNPERGLVLNLTFDEGNNRDFSGNNNSANIRGTVRLTSDRRGQANKAALFEGNGSLEIPHSSSLVLGNNFSVSFFFRTQNFAEGYLAIKGDDTNANSNRAAFRIMTLGTPNNLFADAFYPQRIGYYIPFANNTRWNHFVLTSDRRDLKAYINGALVNTASVTGTLRANTDPIRIGARMFGGRLQNNYVGSLDEVRIYNRTLSNEEVLMLSGR